MGPAHDTEKQDAVLDAALALLESAQTNATITELPQTYLPTSGRSAESVTD